MGAVGATGVAAELSRKAMLMTLAGSDYLLRLSALAVALVGFSAVVVAVLRALGGELTDLHMYYVRLFMEGGLSVAAFSLLPPALSFTGLADSSDLAPFKRGGSSRVFRVPHVPVPPPAAGDARPDPVSSGPHLRDFHHRRTCLVGERCRSWLPAQCRSLCAVADMVASGLRMGLHTEPRALLR